MRRRPRILVDAFTRVFGASRASVAGTMDGAASAAPAPPLVPLRAVVQGPLVWRRDRPFGRSWSLVAGDRVAGWLRATGWRRFEGATAEGGWKLEHDWRHVVRAVGDRATQPTVTYRPGFWRGGKVERRDGERLVWRVVGLGRWRIETEDGRRLVDATPTGFWRPDLALEVHEAARDLNDLAALLLLPAVLVGLARRRRH